MLSIGAKLGSDQPGFVKLRPLMLDEGELAVANYTGHAWRVLSVDAQ